MVTLFFKKEKQNHLGLCLALLWGILRLTGILRSKTSPPQSSPWRPQWHSTKEEFLIDKSFLPLPASL